MNRTLMTVPLAAGLLLAAAGCGSSGGGSPSGGPMPTSATVTNGQITIEGTDSFRFMPSHLVMAHPGPLTITLKDTGSYPHNISFPSLHRTSKTVTGDPGEQTTTLTVQIPRPGTYRFICTYHSSAGMVGELIVH